MRRLLGAVCVLLLVAGVSYGEEKEAQKSLPRDSMVANGSFETVKGDAVLPDQWRILNCDYTGAKGSVRIDKQESYHGVQSICLENTAAKGLVVLYADNKILLSAGDRYTLTGYIKVDTDSLVPDIPKDQMKRSVYLILQTYTDKGYSDVIYCKPMITSTTDGWIELRAENFAIPEKSKYGTVWCVVNGGYTKAWFDNVSMVKTDKPAEKQP